jgi:phosphatidylglycerol:prolipoprotein diacylglycerol transferase
VIPAYGALAALGVLAALFLAVRLAPTAGANPNQVWNLCIVALFAAVVGSRLLLVAVNWSALRLHPRWLLGLAMIHHPLLAATGALIGGIAAILFGAWQRMPFWETADTLAGPLALGLGCEQVGALLAGSGFGTETSVPWAVTYAYPITARWSGTPLGVPVHPVQAYAAIAFLTLALVLRFWLAHRRRPGDVAGLALLGFGVAVYVTEFWWRSRWPAGRCRRAGAGRRSGPLELERRARGNGGTTDPRTGNERRRVACLKPAQFSWRPNMPASVSTSFSPHNSME